MQLLDCGSGTGTLTIDLAVATGDDIVLLDGLTNIGHD